MLVTARGASLVIASAFAATCSCQPITFSYEAAPAARVVQVLGKQLGAVYRVQGDIGKETLLINVRSVDRAALLQRIATILHASWQEKDREQILVRSESQQKALESDEVALRAKWFRLEFAKRIQPILDRPFSRALAHQIALSRSKKISKDGPSASFLRDAEPSKRLAARVLTLFSPEDLASFITPRTLLFSSSPSGPVQPFPKSAESALRLYREEEEVLEEELTAQGVKLKPVVGTSVCATISFGSNQTVFCTIETQGEASLSMNSAALRPFLRSDSNLLLGFEKLQPPKYSPLASALLEKTQLYQQWPEGIRTTAKQWMEHPEVHDPLAGVVGESYVQTAKQLGLQLLAVLPDACAGYTSEFEVAKPFSLKEFLRANQSYCRYESTDGWLTIQPIFPASSLRSKVDRNAMGELFRSFFSEGKTTIEAQSAYFHSFASPWISGIEEIYGFHLGSHLVNSDGRYFSYVGPQTFLYFYGSLTRIQQQTLDSGLLPVASLTEEQRKTLEDIYFEGVAVPGLVKLPLVLPAGSVLWGTRELVPSLTSDFDENAEGEFTLTEIAAQLLFRDRGVYPKKREVLQCRSWQPTEGEHLRYQLDIGIDPPRELLDHTDFLPVGPPVKSLDQLPEKLKSMLAEEYHRLSGMTMEQVYKLVYGDSE